MPNGKPRILLVEDEPKLVHIVSQQLELAGYEILTATDGQEGLAKARVGNPDVIILDLMLPKLTGYEVCTILKQDLRYLHIPIVILTAKAQEMDERLAHECGANAYLTKPYKAKDLLEQVQALLGTVLTKRPPE